MIKTRAGVCWMLLAGGTRGSLFVDFSTAEGAPSLCLAFFEDFFITFVFLFPVVFNRLLHCTVTLLLLDSPIYRSFLHS